MIYIVYFIHVVISLFLILVVLLQQGKGADLSVFGGGASQAAFGARGAATILHKLTVVCFVLFIVTTLTIGILQVRRLPSVMQDVPVVGEEAEASAPAVPAPASPSTTAVPGAAEAEIGAAEAETTTEESDAGAEAEAPPQP